MRSITSASTAARPSGPLICSTAWLKSVTTENPTFEPAGDKFSYIWYWNDAIGLTRTQVPTPIFNDLLAMRAANIRSSSIASNGRAVSLWLAANTKREGDLPDRRGRSHP